ncbi:sulfotransferase domain-containing protein [Micromonospora sp. NPDC005305]|uniref:sulfotransferase domain-containing protein n=1 Tax=Micromonospora sp. NPDC005305 TaxID=3156875 RepID=UPI0033B5D229
MIVWVSSFPRSGNTFLRILLHRLYGVRTSVVYDVDGVATRLGASLVGFEERPAAIRAMRTAEQVHFVKTHRQRDGDVTESDRAICLVRDGRDSLVSWARLNNEEKGREFETELRAMINRKDTVGTGSWGQNVLSWLLPPAAHRVMLRYEDLIREPRASVERVMAELLLSGITPRVDVGIPSFEELHAIDPGFFRRGRADAHLDELSDDLHQLFWSRPDNRAAMKLLGYR